MNKLVAKHPFAAMLVANALLALNSTFGKLGIEEIPSLLYLGIRYMMVALFFLLLAYVAKERIKKTNYGHMLIQSVLQVVMAVAWFVGLGMTQAINSAIIFLLTPIMVYVGSIIFLGEPKSNKALVGSLVAFTGGILMFGAPAFSGGSSEELIGNGLLLVAASFLAAIILHSKKIITEDNINTVLGVRFLAASLAGLLLSIVFQNPGDITSASSTAFIALALAGTISGAFALWVFYKALEHMRAEDSATVFYIDPLVGTIATTIVLGETLSDTGFIAAAVIILGVLISHPAHINRTLYYHKYKHSKFEEFVHWAKREYDSAYKLVKKLF